ncbi:MAG TPA: hypothetical protein VJ725_27175 [Thermoanaerobaculia bacterium]|nr:hypothetical protein [Thermoanaerobaculia bacterium]
MPATVVILSCPQDLHAHAMCEALERKGAEACFFYAPDFPERTELTIRLLAQKQVLESNGPSRMEFGPGCTSVWLRRPYLAKTPDDFEETDRRMIERECRDMILSFFSLLCPDALWVNPLHCFFTERYKPAQLVTAQQCGLKIPPTLISNAPDEILTFVREANRPVVYKTFNSLLSTSIVTVDLLTESDTLRWTPGIYQHYVEKDHELRVTVIGRRLFALRINSQQTVRGKVDWRDAQWQPRDGSSDLTMQPVALPEKIRRSCRRLMEKLGLAYGAIDFVVTPEGEYVFLEVNPSGQFLWADFEAGLPLLDAMSEMLIQGRLDYRWNRRAKGVRFDEAFLKAVEARRSRSMSEHISDLRPW